ncbi:hypothetical protein PoB_002660700 [Plakobranchus ocellatus]|uniref:Uncharacterized protein n=1 Tax=Plakobranchus ocellatus TaxID=259542 RepID=A0AAV3ZZU2_9GAST|nr:hypothetical protein PoB_002660700 [Plakobranchus ocellatus]
MVMISGRGYEARTRDEFRFQSESCKPSFASQVFCEEIVLYMPPPPHQSQCTGMLEGKRSRGKQREKLIEGLAGWLKAGKSLEAIEATKDRKKWRTMIANAVKQGT